MPPLLGDVVARRTNASMGWLSDEFYVTTTGYPPQGSVALAADSDEFMAVWDEDHGAHQDSVWARRLSGTDTPFPFINIAHSPNRHDMESAVAYGNGGRYVLVWRTVVGVQPSWDWNIAGRMVKAGQNGPEGPTFDVDESEGMQKNPAVACATAAPCLVVYEDEWHSGGDYEIRGVLIGHHRISLPLILRRR
jgi:hypothetical protein